MQLSAYPGNVQMIEGVAVIAVQRLDQGRRCIRQ